MGIGTSFGIEAKVHYSAPLGVVFGAWSLEWYFQTLCPDWGAVVIWLTVSGTAVLMLASAAIHAAIHVVVGRVRGGGPRALTLFVFGGIPSVRRVDHGADPKTEFWMGVAGPVGSGAIGVVALSAAAWWYASPPRIPSSPVEALTVWFGYFNLMIAAVNVAPAFPLDGGRVVFALLWWLTRDHRWSMRAAARLGQAAAAASICLGIFWLFFGGLAVIGFWALVVGWVVFETATGLHRQATGLSRGPSSP